MPLLVTGHEDKYIRMFDIVTGTDFILLDSFLATINSCYQGNALTPSWHILTPSLRYRWTLPASRWSPAVMTARFVSGISLAAERVCKKSRTTAKRLVKVCWLSSFILRYPSSLARARTEPSSCMLRHSLVYYSHHRFRTLCFCRNVHVRRCISCSDLAFPPYNKFRLFIVPGGHEEFRLRLARRQGRQPPIRSSQSRARCRGAHHTSGGGGQSPQECCGFPRAGGDI